MDEYMTAEQVAITLGVSRNTLARRVATGAFPRATHQCGSRLMWRADVVLARSRITPIAITTGERRG